MAAALPWISMAMTAVSAISSANAAKQQAGATADAAQYQAQVSRNNQIIAEQNAQQEKMRGEVLAQQKQQETAQKVGAVAAATGASGMEMSGSPLRLQDDTLALGDLDARTIRANAEKAAYGYRVQGSNYGAQADLSGMGSENALKGGNLGAWSSIISGGAGVADKWTKFKKEGAISDPFSD